MAGRPGPADPEDLRVPAEAREVPAVQSAPHVESVRTAPNDQSVQIVPIVLSVEIGLTGGNPLEVNERGGLVKTARAGLQVPGIVTSELLSMMHPVMMIRLLMRMRFPVSSIGLHGVNSKL